MVIAGLLLFHVKPYWILAAEFAGLAPDQRQVGLMERFSLWLRTEGVAAGGIGSGEVDRIDRRHLADSLLLASELAEATSQVWDLGSGAGLPGIPLAICMPETEYVLIDRSGRRVDLMRRAVRVLGLDNCEVRQADFERLTTEIEAIVSRASLPPAELRVVVERCLAPGGVAVVAGSWRTMPDEVGWTTVEIPRDVLDQTVWLLIMRRQ